MRPLYSVACFLSLLAFTSAKAQKLRVLPLGDSITWGFRSPDGNGYRLSLSQSLLSDDDIASSGLIFAGTERSGNMPDNWNEGHNGYAISQVRDVALPALEQRPNVILLHVGTNDLNVNPLHQAYDEAPSRLIALIDDIFHHCPDTILFLAKIVQSGVRAANDRGNVFNDMIPGIVEMFNDQKHKTVMVDMSVITPSDLLDRVHPKEDAYRRMGEIWSQAIIANLPNITEPVGPDPDPNRPSRGLGDGAGYSSTMNMLYVDWTRILAGFGTAVLTLGVF